MKIVEPVYSAISEKTAKLSCGFCYIYPYFLTTKKKLFRAFAMKLQPKYFVLFPILILLLLFTASCNTTEPPPFKEEPPKAIKLKLLDASLTEAFIKVTAADSVLPVNITLNKDEAALFSFALTKPDTIIIDTTLQLNTTYTYQTIAQINGKEQKSDTLQVKTLNTTSHNFTWQTFTFGEPSAGSSVLNDVAIIDENNIWAVGEIYADTTGQAYNAVHWNGTNWELKRILYYGTCSAVEYPPLKAIFTFSDNKILVTNGGSIGWLAGDSVQLDCRVNPLLSGAINKIWGSSSNDFYAVGNSGSIAHYQNGVWSKIESGTTTNINDIWGVIELAENDQFILCTVSSRYHLGEYKLLSITGNVANEYFNWPYTRLYGIWFNSPRNVFIVGDGAFVYKNNILKTINLSTNYFLTRVKGNALNDIYISSSDAQVYHYNGLDWYEQNNGIFGKYEGLDVKGNSVVLVGYNIEGGIVGKAIITIEKHY